MGFAVSTLDIPVTKTTSGVLFLTEDEIDTRPTPTASDAGGA